MGFSRFVRTTDNENDLENGTNQVNSQSSMANANNRQLTAASSSSNGSEEDDVVNLEENLRVSSRDNDLFSIKSICLSSS